MNKGTVFLPEQALASIYERQVVTSRTFLADLESQGRARGMDVHYHDAIADPAARLAAYLAGDEGGSPFDMAAAAAVVDPALHRARARMP